MTEVLKNAKSEIENCKSTGDIRKLSAKLFRNLSDKTITAVFQICNVFLEEHDWALGVIAFDFAYRVKKQYNDETFSIFESWLEEYVRGWGDCDDFCTHALGELIIQNPTLFTKIIRWTEREKFWMRRASAVVLIPSIRHDHYKNIAPLNISDRLMTDEHDLVRKGYGWMLKILSYKEPQFVYDYLVENKDRMPRVAFRYAIEKMDEDKKQFLMGL